MIRATFQLVRGLGPRRERALWAAGLRDWTDVLGATATDLRLPLKLCDELKVAVEELRACFEANDLVGVATRMPTGEHWRLFEAFESRAVYLDIETDREEGVTVVGLLDREGPRCLLAGRDLARVPGYVPADCLLVTFNGASFDVPMLRKHFEAWQAPPAHMDLRHVWNRLGHWGGLKALEDAVGIGRPAHLKHLDGSHASWLWQHARLGDRAALTKLVEYNLYDVINLRTLAALGWNCMVQQHGFPERVLPVSFRGDVLYDVSRLLMAL